MRRALRAALAVLAFLTLATPVPPGPDPGPGEAGVARLFAESVPLDPEAPADRRLGPFRYLGGWVLTSDDRRFGSISSMHVRDGWITALGDRGVTFRFPVPDSAVERVVIHPLGGGPGAFRSSTDRDSESLAVAGGRAWIGYENSNQIWRYRLSDWRAEANAAPEAMRNWPANRGAETMLRLGDGRFLLIGEDDDAQGISPALLFLGDPTEPGTHAVPLRVKPPPGYRITDAAQAPDGKLLLIARGFGPWTLWSAKLLLAELPEQAGGEIGMLELASLASPLTVDNMEAVSVAREGRRVIVWIASDDNLFPLQRTLLMKFEWVE